MGDLGLMDAAGDGVADQLLMTLGAGATEIDLLLRLAGLVGAIGIDAGEGADAARRGPGAGTLAIRHRDALAALDQRQHLPARDDERFQGNHAAVPPSSAARCATPVAPGAARPPLCKIPVIYLRGPPTRGRDSR